MDAVRRWVRRNTRPISRSKARLFYGRLSIVYYMLGWTAGGVALHHMFMYDSDSLPQNLDVHADPNAQNKPNVYKKVEMINKPSDDTEVKIISVRNFSVQSVEKYEVRSLQQQAEDTRNRATEDFFGDNERSPNEELI